MFISEIIETLGEGEAEMEVCATAETEYSPSSQKISVALDTFARMVSVSGEGERVPKKWLPPAEHVTEHLAPDETAAFAKDVFQSWVKKVRAAIPHELRPAI